MWLFDRTKVQFVFYVNSIKLTKVKINKKKPAARITTNLTTGRKDPTKCA
jgi:hypothetical protein